MRRAYEVFPKLRTAPSLSSVVAMVMWARRQYGCAMIHIVKLCVGAESIEDLAEWQAERLALQKQAGVEKPQIFHTTFQAPKRQAELLDGGSLYWVIKGLISVRQRLVGFGAGQKADGKPACVLLLDSALVQVRPVPRRPFQGWRYLNADAAPADLKAGAQDATAEMPAAMRKELAGLGLL